MGVREQAQEMSSFCESSSLLQMCSSSWVSGVLLLVLYRANVGDRDSAQLCTISETSVTRPYSFLDRDGVYIPKSWVTFHVRGTVGCFTFDGRRGFQNNFSFPPELGSMAFLSRKADDLVKSLVKLSHRSTWILPS